MSHYTAPFKTWIRLYATAAGISSITLEAKLRNTTHVFNQRLATIRLRHGYSPTDLCGLIYFAFLHNPLNIAPQQYGDIDNVCACVRAYNVFCREHAEAVLRDGPVKVVIANAPAKAQSAAEVDGVRRFL